MRTALVGADSGTIHFCELIMDLLSLETCEPYVNYSKAAAYSPSINEEASTVLFDTFFNSTSFTLTDADVGYWEVQLKY